VEVVVVVVVVVAAAAIVDRDCSSSIHIRIKSHGRFGLGRVGQKPSSRHNSAASHRILLKDSFVRGCSRRPATPTSATLRRPTTWIDRRRRRPDDAAATARPPGRRRLRRVTARDGPPSSSSAETRRSFVRRPAGWTRSRATARAYATAGSGRKSCAATPRAGSPRRTRRPARTTTTGLSRENATWRRRDVGDG